MPKRRKLEPPSAARSRIMSSIRSRGNRATELLLARLLRASRVSGWRRHMKLPGTPDFAFPAARVAVFVDGCFWHGCPRCWVAPKTNPGFWRAKVVANLARDRRVTRRLREMGWSVVRVWGHALVESPQSVVTRIGRVVSARRPRTLN